MPNYIGISDNRLKHIRAVADKCYKLALERGFSEDESRKMYFLGFLHDIGYRFSEKSNEHPDVGAEIIAMAGIPYRDAAVVQYHGKIPPSDSDIDMDEWRILAEADLTINSEGNEVATSERLIEVSDRYGSKSSQYENALNVAKKLNLVDDTFL